MTFDDRPTCARTSNYCDLVNPVEPHLVENVFVSRGEDGKRPVDTVMLCRFHGQGHRKVGESDDDYLRRSRHVSAAMRKKRRDDQYRIPPKEQRVRQVEEVTLPKDG